MENIMFDYQSCGKKLTIPANIIAEFEKEAHEEFPFDRMLMEIHVLRALKSYNKTSSKIDSNEK